MTSRFFPNGTPLTITGDHDPWYQITANGLVGYLHHTWTKVDQFERAPFSQRHIQIKSFSSFDNAESFVRSSSIPVVAHLASNGWFAVTLAGTFEEQVAARELARLKASNEVPNDSFITYGNTYVRNVCCDGDATQMSATGQLSWEQFGVASAYSGKTALPDFKGRERAFKDFRTRIVDGMKNGPNFAGTFSVVQFGCGTGCTFVVIANNKTAELYNFPRGGEDNMYLQLNFELKSRLIVAQWSDGDNCILEDFEWIGKEAKILSKQKIGADAICFSDIEENLPVWQRGAR